MTHSFPPSGKSGGKARFSAWLKEPFAPAGVHGAATKEVRTGLIVAGVFLLGVVGWAAVAPLDAAVVASGQIAVFGNRQSVQHRDGGIVSELNVHEGDHVKAGQVLLRLANDELKASARSTSALVIEQKALQARLMAEMKGARSVEPPAEFAALTGEDKDAADTAMLLERMEFSRRAQAIGVERGILASQIGQSSQQAQGYGQQLTANREQQRLIGQEIEGLKPLLERGLTPMTRMRSLQRDQADLKGSEGAYSANVARTAAEIGEKRIRMVDLISQRDADDAKEYRLAQSQLSELEPKLAALKAQIDRTEVRSPATGEVVGLSVFTVRGVVGAGQKIMDIVPSNEALVVDAKVKASDADDLHEGQMVEIRVPAFRDRGMPYLKGEITKVSADSFSDEKTGVSYFRIEASVPPTEMTKVNGKRGAEKGLRPGLPVEMVVPLRSRTALSYLMEPLTHRIWTSFREH
ncbi:MAG: HlyD family type I secretion periplasmic adaptor subunit [Caulobacteraceae bacterium]|nr:HlyD family type I secretion periplasmic adaptor subunit [Caulobacteraceae bacterium]